MKKFFAALALACLLALAGGASPASESRLFSIAAGDGAATTSLDSAWKGKVQPRLLDESYPSEGRDVVVLFHGRADLSPAAGLSWLEKGRFVHRALLSAAEQDQAELIALLESRPGSYRSYSRHIALNAVTIAGLNSPDLLGSMARLSRVNEVRAAGTHDVVQPVTLEKGPEALGTLPWGLADINAPALWDLGIKGRGIVIGSIDSGVRFTHEALAARYRGAADGKIEHDYNWFDPLSGSAVPEDASGHGTHTTGTMVGVLPSGRPLGVAPEARWIACRGCDSACSDQALLTCLDWVLAPWPVDGAGPAGGDPDRRPHLVNNSWGNDGCDDMYEAALLNLRAAGIFPSFSIGNSGPGCGSAGQPGGLVQAFSTGAHDPEHGLAPFSGRGPYCGTSQIKPDLTGPGTSVYSSFNNSDSDYYYAGGTSMAAPHTAGAAALLWSAKPWLVGEVDLTEQILRDTAFPVADGTCDPAARTMEKTPNYSWGYGRLDVLAAHGWSDSRAAVSPARQRRMGTNGQTLTYAYTVYNQTDHDLPVELRLGEHFWDASLSTGSLVVPAGGSAGFSADHVIPAAPVADEESVAVAVAWSGGAAEVRFDTKTRSARPCACPRRRVDFLMEEFEGAFPPDGWKVVNNHSAGVMGWVRNDEAEADNITGGSGLCAAAAARDDNPIDTELWTKSLDLSGLDAEAELVLEFNYYYFYYDEQEHFEVDLSRDQGRTWENAWTAGYGDRDNNKKTVSLGARDGDGLLVRFHYFPANRAIRALIDNVNIYACEAPAEGAVICPRADLACPGGAVRPLALWNFGAAAESFDLAYKTEAGQIGGPPVVGPVPAGSSETFDVSAILPFGPYGSTVLAQVDATGVASGAKAQGKITTQLGGWKAGAEAPFATADNPVVAFNGRIYVFGGLGVAGQVGIYDPGSDAWTSGATLSEKVIPSPGCGILGFNAAGEAVATMFPGSNSRKPYLLNVYNIDRDSWTTPAVPEVIGGPSPFPACISDVENNVGYLVSGNWVGRLIRYHPADNTAEELPEPPLARGRAAAWLWQGKVCLAGGINTDHETYRDVPLNSTQCFDLEQGVWNAENTDLPALPHTWWGMAYDLIDGRPALVSGLMGTHASGGGVRYDPIEGAWTSLPVAPRVVLQAGGTTLDGRFYLIGGGVPNGLVQKYTQVLQECLDQPTELTISGTLKTPDGSPVADATILGPAHPGASDSNGRFSVAVPWGWTGALAVVKRGWIFLPASRSYEKLDYDPADQDFTAVAGNTPTGGKAPACFVSALGD
ncbi:MAG: S8 family serine peptidase [Pseudomonadota bacterium]